MLSKAQKEELKAEIDSYGFKPLESLPNGFIDGITLKGYRLSKSEKESIAFHYLNDNLDLNNYAEVEKIVLFDRKLANELKEEEKKIKQFEKTLGRLADENMEGYVHESDYYEYGVIIDGINYLGAVEYAKYWYRTRF